MEIKIPKYDNENGISYNWENGFTIETKIKNGTINIAANREGLISLANHLLNLSQDDIPSGYHMHFDENSSLEAGSAEILIQKK